MPDETRRPVFDKSKLPSRHVTVGPERAPHRSYYYAMGLDEDDIAQPFVGVATCWNEAAPCNIALSRQAQVVVFPVAVGQNIDAVIRQYGDTQFSRLRAFWKRQCAAIIPERHLIPALKFR